MNTSNWTNNPAWNALAPEKKEILQNLISQTRGLPPSQALPHLLQAQSRLREKNLSFTQKETDLLLQVFSSGLSPKEKATFETLRHFVKN